MASERRNMYEKNTSLSVYFMVEDGLSSEWFGPGYCVTQKIDGHGNFAFKLAGLRNEGNCGCGVSETVGHVPLDTHGNLRAEHVRNVAIKSRLLSVETVWSIQTDWINTKRTGGGRRRADTRVTKAAMARRPPPPIRVDLQPIVDTRHEEVEEHRVHRVKGRRHTRPRSEPDSVLPSTGGRRCGGRRREWPHLCGGGGDFLQDSLSWPVAAPTLPSSYPPLAAPEIALRFLHDTTPHFH
ncbi:hypothetical protein AAG570_013809 [Ranatra chinensis]|uniref:Uncharacterized protein n=1 Tax=Ranatra chinensis TaxID=642074 RepID=A0ABD0YD98_9HEMI